MYIGQFLHSYLLHKWRNNLECTKAYLFVTKNVARPEALSILSIGIIELSSLIYLAYQKNIINEKATSDQKLFEL